MTTEASPNDFVLANTFGVDAMAFSDPDPEFAIINFSSMNIGKFERWSWFYQRRLRVPCLYLFLRDDDQHYYLGKEGKLASSRLGLIRNELEKHRIPERNTLTIGSSMGGYASVYFAHELESRAAMSINPQVDVESASLHNLTNWVRKMREVGNGWVDLHDFVLSHAAQPTIYLRTGNYIADRVAGEKLQGALIIKGHRVIREYDEIETHGWGSLSSGRFFEIVEHLAFD
ncbi:hypothetical protein [Rhizobium sp. YS-1r]|uniref:hypothetical protein n=1 Tax=Rhizobium sp. YS-1r TaxID=1532558 RepID=UPI0005100ADD|nr:hypothetical protein [Rhizobium sp. YS-1r]KGE01632.1 hypothetical protein JL39_04495 [Rhizobium sp. YS-1r]